MNWNLGTLGARFPYKRLARTRVWNLTGKSAPTVPPFQIPALPNMPPFGRPHHPPINRNPREPRFTADFRPALFPLTIGLCPRNRSNCREI